MLYVAVHNVFVVDRDMPRPRRERESDKVGPCSPCVAPELAPALHDSLHQPRRPAQQRALTDACRALATSTSIEEIYRIVMPQAAEMLGASRSLLLLPDELGRPRIRSAFGIEPALLTQCNALADADLAACLLRALDGSAPEHVLAVPVLVRSGPPGLLGVRLNTAVHDEDRWALAVLADQAAVALDLVGGGSRRQNEELLCLLVDALTDHVIVALDVEGRVETWNHGAARALGYSAAEALRRPFVEFYAPGQGDLPATSLRRAGEQGRHEGEATLTCKGGGHLLASVLIVALSEPDGRRRGFAVLGRDITAQRAAEQAQRAAERERLRAESANRMKDEFLATVSHELRTPLTAILGWARILRDANYDRARVTKGVEVIERNARAQVRIVEDILDISRIITGKVKLELVPVDPRLVIEAAVSTLESTANAVGVEVQVRVDPELGAVLGDCERLQQVLWNLLSNAIKFTPDGGKIEVAAVRRGELLEISVKDSGRGIAPGFLPHVFERFRQDDASSTRSVGGLGLGLAIVRQLVELHRGTVSAASDGHGRGSTFIVRLPTIHGPALPPQPKPIATSPEQAVALIGLSLLVVDDEPDTRDLLTTIFEGSGARITAVGSAREALAELQAGGIDLLVSDISMPSEDGFWLIRQVRACADAKLKRIPALALTAYARAEDRHRVQGAGFQVYLSKPIHPEELVKVVGDLAARLVVPRGP